MCAYLHDCMQICTYAEIFQCILRICKIAVQKCLRARLIAGGGLWVGSDPRGGLGVGGHTGEWVLNSNITADLKPCSEAKNYIHRPLKYDICANSGCLLRMYEVAILAVRDCKFYQRRLFSSEMSSDLDTWPRRTNLLLLQLLCFAHPYSSFFNEADAYTILHINTK